MKQFLCATLVNILLMSSSSLHAMEKTHNSKKITQYIGCLDIIKNPAFCARPKFEADNYLVFENKNKCSIYDLEKKQWTIKDQHTIESSLFHSIIDGKHTQCAAFFVLNTNSFILGDQGILLRSLKTGEIIETFMNIRSIESWHFLPNNLFLFSADNKIHVYDIKKDIEKIKKNFAPKAIKECTSDNAWFVTKNTIGFELLGLNGYGNRHIKKHGLYRIDTLEKKRSYQAINFIKNGTYSVFLKKNLLGTKNLYLYDRAHKKTTQLTNKSLDYKFLCSSKNGNYILYTDSNKHYYIYDIPNKKTTTYNFTDLETPFGCSGKTWHSLLKKPYNQYMLFMDQDHKLIKILNHDENKIHTINLDTPLDALQVTLLVFIMHTSMPLSPSKQWLALPLKNNKIVLYDLKNNQLHSTFSHSYLMPFGFSPNSQLIHFTLSDRSLKVYDIVKKQLFFTDQNQLKFCPLKVFPKFQPYLFYQSTPNTIIGMNYRTHEFQKFQLHEDTILTKNSLFAINHDDTQLACTAKDSNEEEYTIIFDLTLLAKPLYFKKLLEKIRKKRFTDIELRYMN